MGFLVVVLVFYTVKSSQQHEDIGKPVRFARAHRRQRVSLPRDEAFATATILHLNEAIAAQWFRLRLRLRLQLPLQLQV